MLIAIIALFISSVFFLVISKKIHNNVIYKKKQYRIPNGKITYSDLNIPAKPFFSKRYRTTGKPDYVIIENDKYIPIELKSGSGYMPRENHILQIATYCQLLEETYGGFVPYGRLVYNDSDFKIPFDPKLRFELESAITKMRYSLHQRKIRLNHNNPGKCRVCTMRKYCRDNII
jgi:CRISPR-associated exonuclease Cas4